MSTDFVLLGGDGDLAGRLLLPAIAELVGAGRPCPEIVAVGRKEYGDDEYRAWLGEALATHGDGDEDAARTVTEHARYRSADVTDAGALGEILRDLDDPVVYLALPNAIFADTLRALAAAGTGDGTRIVVEKPFGTDRGDARDLNRLLHEIRPESHVFRVDHFLGMNTVLELLGARFANRVFEPVWNSEHIERVDIVFDEALGLEGRAGYYDSAGALRDMLQNHLLQVLALVAMEPPDAIDAGELARRRGDVLRDARVDLEAPHVRARYTAGTIGERELPAYADEEGVDPGRETETYAEFTVRVDTPRWDGVPFRLRTGKALATGRRDVTIRFRPPEHSPFDGAPDPDELTFRLDPDGVVLAVNLTRGDDPESLARCELTYTPPPGTASPYATVLAGILDGDGLLSISDVEAEECWRIVEPVLRAWESGDVPLQTYPAGSAGP
ncbi:glucose-6-phosphate dehydrogenase [Rhodococcus rhodnii]|uniref:Glucose-6-phosphate 1-dehydrogenase n=2 Tax=Rhodococcus rhodnii TaxID=38312 RepID=R7WSY9_9NOCA|nr:glucose-6-phosphate dehydrogenase [Rhodococcus rhodnii]EOM78385.1 glucose-6-phosphate 1-dehydrogenase [Rhodococcus rhodnii LMG 5362]TXG91209.1 glucose-6-phosphate dehydrogenase [Rhodococcus rhodnii]